jgi:hypothetical protein
MYVPFRLPVHFNKPSLTFSLTPSCNEGCTVAGSASRTFAVNVAPSLSDALFSTAVRNDASNSTTLTVTASDPSGVSDIASVVADLTPVGGAKKTALYDDGKHGDMAAGDGIWGLTGIRTTTASTGIHRIMLTVTDSGGNTGTTAAQLAVQPPGSPLVTLDSQTRPVVSDVSDSTSNAITWRSSQACGPGGGQGYRIVLGGTAGDPNTGTVLRDWQASGCSAYTPRTDTVSASNLAAGANSVYVYVKTADSQLGYLAVTISKDTTAPIVFINTKTYIVRTNHGTLSWHAEEAGTYTVRVGGSAGNPASGRQTTGSNSSGVYSARQASDLRVIKSEFLNSDLVEGENSLFFHFTDLGNNVTSQQFTVVKNSTSPVPAPAAALTDK